MSRRLPGRCWNGRTARAERPALNRFGWWLAIGHLVTGVLLCLTIIGIPLGLASFKIIPVTLVPLGVRIVPEDRRYAEAA